MGILLLTATACSGTGSPDTSPHQDVTAELGAVPIPTAPKAERVAVASRHRPAVLAMGAPVLARLGDGTQARLTMLGPAQSTRRPGAESTAGTFTVRVAPVAGQLTVGARDLSSRDQTGHAVRLRAVGVRAITATPSRPGTLRVVGRYGSGAAQVTYRHAGQVVAVWDFNIELD